MFGSFGDLIELQGYRGILLHLGGEGLKHYNQRKRITKVRLNTKSKGKSFIVRVAKDWDRLPN